MLALTRVDEMALTGVPLTVMEGDVVSRLRHIQRTLQECTRKVNRVDLALQTRNSTLQPRYNSSNRQNHTDTTRVETDEEDTEGVREEGIKEDSNTTRKEYPKEDIEETETEVTHDIVVREKGEFYDALIDNEVFTEDEDDAVCVRTGNKEKKKGDIKEQETSRTTTLALQKNSDEEVAVGSEQSNDTQRPPLLRHARIEVENTEYAETVTIDPLTLHMDSHPMSTDLSPYTDPKFQPNASHNNTDILTLLEQEETHQEEAVENVDTEEIFTGIWEESGYEGNDRGDPLAERIPPEQTDRLRRVYEDLYMPQLNTPETPWLLHPDQRQNSSSRTKKWSEIREATDPHLYLSDSLDYYSPLCSPQRSFVVRANSFSWKEKIQHDIHEWSNDSEEEECKYYDSCSHLDVSHPQQGKNLQATETDEMCGTSLLKVRQLVDVKGFIQDDEVVSKSSIGCDDVTAERRRCDCCKVNKSCRSEEGHSRTFPDQEGYQKLRQQENSQLRFSQDIKSSMASVVVVLLLLCLLLFLSCCLMLVVPVVTVSVRTYGGSPAF